ncbi:unnamed protein product [marine sediment metagenome]|uniref:Uncharacterized protein n=1 Tax=marine sediment metagenome TaxID=412755 RepID=X1SDS1_9ZZZZ
MQNYETPPVAGPGRIGQLAAIAAGYYTDIINIIAPAQAAAGETVWVEVWVRNLHTTPIYIATTGRYNGVSLFFPPRLCHRGCRGNLLLRQFFYHAQ